MTMRNYFVTIHEDGHVTVQEYEEPKEFVYPSGEGKVVRDAYNEALRDVKIILETEKTFCQEKNKQANNTNDTIRQVLVDRYLECCLLEAAIAKLFRKS